MSVSMLSQGIGLFKSSYNLQFNMDGALSPNLTLTLSKIDALCTITIPNFEITATSNNNTTIVSNSSLPSGFIPNQKISFTIYVSIDITEEVGTLYINPNGTISMEWSTGVADTETLQVSTQNSGLSLTYIV